MLKYNRINPSFSVIAVSLIKKSFLNNYLSFLTFSKGSRVSFENNFDSNHRIIQGVIPDLCYWKIYVSESACAICSKTNENQSIFRLFVWMFCRIDEKLFFYWFLTQKSENFPVFMALTGWRKIPKVKPIVSQTLECGLSKNYFQIKTTIHSTEPLLIELGPV